MLDALFSRVPKEKMKRCVGKVHDVKCPDYRVEEK